jgi:signal transduction histidine kinase
MSALFSPTNIMLRMDMRSTWLRRWVYPLVAGFMYFSVLLRAILIFQGTPFLGKILVPLLVFPIIFLGNELLALRFPWISYLLTSIELLITLSLILITHSIHSDFFAFLFAIAGMQVMQQYTIRGAVFVVGVSALMIFFGLLQPVGVFQALALTLTYTSLNTFLVAYIGSTRHALTIQEQQHALSSELQETNRKLADYSRQLQQLATSQERQRLARELHDAVTQTIFSMTLATQSARFLVNRDRHQVAAQLDRLDHLVQSALSEMQVLTYQLVPTSREGSFLDVLRQHIADRQRLDNLSIDLQVGGDQPLNPTEETNLLRIAQEALNNVVKHGRISTAVLRLHLADPFWMEVEDRGAGFDPQQAKGGGRLGLAGMRERASEIGWIFEVESAIGRGTCIRVRKGAREI